MEPKKSPPADLEKRRGLFLQIGFVVSLLITLVAFEWKSYENNDFAFGNNTIIEIPEELIPITRQEEKPPPPPPPVQQIVIVEDEKIIENEADIMETEIDQETVVEVSPVVESVVDEPEIFILVEDMPEFPGGQQELFKYIAKHVKYPAAAREFGVAGVVMLSFVIAPDGQVKNVEVLKGIGHGCDEEAVRVVNTMPKWKPGKQRGKAVPVRYGIPVRFQLS